MALIIEFVGLPAAGKSTLGGELEAELRARGIRLVVQAASQPVSSKVRSVWRHRVAAWAVARALLRSARPCAQRIRAFRWIISTFVLYDGCASDLSGAVLVVPEGIAQRAALAFFDPQSTQVRGHIDDYLMDAPKPGLVVALEIGPALSVDRQGQRRVVEGMRRHSRVADRFDLEPPELLDAMQRMHRLISSMVDQLISRHGVDVLRIDARDLDGAIDDVRGFVVGAVVERIERL